MNVILLKKMFNLILFIRNDFYLCLLGKEWIFTILFLIEYFIANFILKMDFYKLFNMYIYIYIIIIIIIFYKFGLLYYKINI